MMKAAHVLLSFVLAVVPLGAQTDAHLYSPETNLERSELAQLETATRSVDVAMYSFHRPRAGRRAGGTRPQRCPGAGVPGSRAVSAGKEVGGCDDDLHPPRGRDRGPGQRWERPDAPQELCHRRADAADRLRTICVFRVIRRRIRLISSSARFGLIRTSALTSNA